MAVRAQPEEAEVRGQLLSEFLAPEVGLPQAPYAAQAIKMTLGRHLASTRWCFDRRCALSENRLVGMAIAGELGGCETDAASARPGASHGMHGGYWRCN
jgi:hypothetical protein